MNTLEMKQSALTCPQRGSRLTSVSRLLFAAALLLPFGENFAQTPQKLSIADLQPLSPAIYISKFTCGSQRQLSVNLPTAVESGRYSTAFAVFNPAASLLRNVEVFASIESESAVPVISFNLQAFETKVIDCSDIFGVLGVLPVPDATVGYIYVKRFQDDMEVQATFSRTTPSSSGAAIDVERINPRPMKFSRLN